MNDYNEYLKESFSNSSCTLQLVKTALFEDGAVEVEYTTRCTDIGLITEIVQRRAGHDSSVSYVRSV